MKRILTTLALGLCIAASASAQVFDLNLKKDTLERVYLELPLLDMPYQATVTEKTSGNFLKSYTNQSMATTLALCEDYQVGTHLLIRQLLGRHWYTRLAGYGFDLLTSQNLPFGTSWAHEEYHRAVMAYRGVDSFDEVWKCKFFASEISVSHETDEALAAFHDGYASDFIRMNAAGLEAQTHLVQRTQRNDFFYHRALANEMMYWMSLINNWGYLDACASPDTDKDVQEMNAKEVNVEDRDFTGMDLSAWAFELFHPGNKYADRGTHPSGTGINRYIMYDQIGEDGVAYLKKQANRELLNLVSPMMILIPRIRLAHTKSGDIYGNFSMRHYLTSFGDDTSLDLLFDTPWAKFYAAPHLYSNYVKSFPGLEVGVVDQHFCNNRLRLNASANLWSQPEEFRSDSGKFGGCIAADAAWSFGRFEPYVEIGGKTAGWLVGNVQLGSTFNCRAGLRWLVFDGSASRK